MNINDEKIKKNINDLFEEKSFTDIAKNSMGHLKPSAYRKCFLILFFIVCFVLLYFTDYFCIGVKNILNLLLPILATLLTMSFAGFAIFQVMISPESMKIFLKNNSGSKSLFLDVNLEYFALFILELVLLIVGVCLIIVLNLFPLGLRVSIFSNRINIILASGFVALYFAIFLDAIIEIKSFAFNLYSCFKLVALNTFFNDIEK